MEEQACFGRTCCQTHLCERSDCCCEHVLVGQFCCLDLNAFHGEVKTSAKPSGSRKVEALVLPRAPGPGTAPDRDDAGGTSLGATCETPHKMAALEFLEGVSTGSLRHPPRNPTRGTAGKRPKCFSTFGASSVPCQTWNGVVNCAVAWGAGQCAILLHSCKAS